jgi:hypothetical protein
MEEETKEDRHRDFATNIVAAIFQLPGQRGNVDMFQKTKPKSVIHLEECSYD